MKAEIENIGPIERFEYEMASPGLHVLRGAHGCYIHSAQVDDGPLRCEAWSNSSVSPNSSKSSPAAGLF